MEDMASDLKGFKIGDHVKAPVERPRPGMLQKAEKDAASAGFPHVEALVESSAPDVQGLRTRLAALRELAETGTSKKEKAAAQKAVVAYERVGDLLEFLFQTKEQLGRAKES
jgi:hypothetical protein